jgi:hypothetical protein
MCSHEYTVIDGAHGWDFRGSPTQTPWVCVRCLHCGVCSPKFDGRREPNAGLKAQVAWYGGILALPREQWPPIIAQRWEELEAGVPPSPLRDTRRWEGYAQATCAACEHPGTYHSAAGCGIEQCGCLEFRR